MTTKTNHTDNAAATSAEETPTISPIIGVGPAAHRLVRVGRWCFTAQVGDEEPRIQDLELAERLGYERPRDIRKLIKDLRVAGKLNDITHRDEQARAVGQVAARPTREFWLTEAQALKVVAKSETAIADALLDEVIHVFMLARRGLLGFKPANDVDLERVVGAAIERHLETIIDRLDAHVAMFGKLAGGLGEIAHAVAAGHALAVDTNGLVRKVASRDGTIAGEDVDKLKDKVARIVEIRAAQGGLLGDRRAMQSIRADVYADLFACVEWGRKGQSLRAMPADKGPIAKAHLEYQMRKLLAGKGKARAPKSPKQGELFDKAN